MTEDKPRKTLTLKRKPKAKAAEASHSEEINDDVTESVRGRKRVIKMQSAAQKKAIKDSKLSPSERQSRELKRLLAETFSVWRRRRPLARGIDEQIAAFIETQGVEISKRAVKKLLHRHTHHKSYLQNVARGGVRFKLDGTEDGEILPEERDHARRAMESLES
ncbi:ProQ/FINO family protein [Leucothrix pacifica]|uniref:ProQ/FinO domain-containing protein n=1 Tax=Leucothrix pacifica TaxID=1247513 RepID=A0A317CLM2_9GAMM|nr:ProQ/FINO family protein [Leucothrix pacifica]PWQ99269.1 hypothetical protein DKW60_05950 [Leucothrix pacifica]